MRRSLLLASLIYLLVLTGLATRERGLLVLALPLLIHLAAALAHGPAALRLTARRTVSADRVLEGTPVTVQIALINEGTRLEQVLVEDVLPARVELLTGSACALASLGRGETLELSYSVRCRRGRAEFESVQVTASDQLGLWQRRVALPAPATVAVLPATLRLRRLAIRPLRTRGYAGPVPARQGGSGTDFFGVREYQSGDPRHWINWRVSARHPSALFTNEFEQERIADVGLILDARERSDVQVPGDSLFEHAVRATASLAGMFLQEGNRVGLLVYGRYLDWTFPGYGKVQREQIMQALARAETGESRVFEHLDYLPTRYFPAQSQLVLVSPVWPDDVPMLVQLRARGYQLLVIRPDAVTFEARQLPSDRAVELAVRILRVERAMSLRRMQQAGIPVVDWQVDQPFDEVVNRSLGRVPLWFRAIGLEPQP